MAEIIVRLASDKHDFDVARTLCLEWLDWHWKNYPAGWPRDDDHPMNSQRFKVALEALPVLYKRPLGGVLIASVDGEPAGCVMYGEASTGVAEFNRMFVSVSGRGHGLGRKLLNRMVEQMIADGYTRVFFSSATFLTHARAMYEAAGFALMPQPKGFPKKLRDKVYFMERLLT